MLFEDAYNEFKIYVENRHKKQGFITLCTDFNNHVLPYFKGRDVKTITKTDIIYWQNSILKHNFKNKYNSKIYYSFNCFGSYCVLSSYWSNNIVRDVGNFPKKIELNTHNVYTLNQFRKFRRCLKNFPIREYFNFMYFYGTRPGETMALKFSDMKGKYIRIIHNLRRKGDRGLDTPKNQSSLRCFKISLLQKFRIFLLKFYYIKKYGAFSDDYFIFGGPKPLSPTTIDRYKKLAYQKAKLPNITQHEFRHSYATRNIHNKKPIDEISRSMGHSKVSTTLDIYLHQEKNTLNVFPS